MPPHLGGLPAEPLNVTLCNVTMRNAQLTDLQQAVLKVIWTGGEATAEQVREGLLPTRPLKDSSVRTVLRRLEARGYLSHRVEGKTFVYRAERPSASIAASAVRRIIDRFWAGSTERFLVGMVDEEVLSVEDLERLARQAKGKAGREGAS